MRPECRRKRVTAGLSILFLSVAGLAVAQPRVPYFRTTDSSSMAVARLAVPGYGGTISARVGHPLSVPAAVPVGGYAPYAITLSGAMPAGLEHVGAGAITGSPTVAGDFPLSLRVRDARGATVEGPVRIVVDAAQTNPITLSLAPLPPTEVIVGTLYTGALTVSGGTGPYSFLTTGNVPADIGISGGSLTGTFQTPGTFSFGVTASDSQPIPAEDEVNFTTTVFRPFTAELVGIPQASATIGVDIASVRIVPDGGKLPYSYGSTGTIPHGLNYANGILSGKPNAPGTFTFALTAGQDLPGVPARQSPTYTMVVSAAPLEVAGTALPAEYVLGEALVSRPSITATGGTAPYVYSAEGLPSGMTLNASNGTTTGAPDAEGTYSFVLTAKDSGSPQRSGTIPQSVRVYQALTLAGNKPAYINSGTPVSGFGYTATGGKGSHSFTLASGSLPSSLSLQTDGTVVGTPTGSGQANYIVRVTDELGAQKTLEQSLYYAPPLQVRPTLPDGEQNQPYAQAVVSGGRGPITATMTAGTLPTGVNFSNGSVNGYPTSSGTYNFQVTATDADGRTDSRTVTLTVASSAMAASRSLIDQATYSGSGSGFWTLRHASPYNNNPKSGYDPMPAADALEVAKDPVAYAYDAPGSMYSKAVSGGGTAKVIGTFRFSQDVVASSADQVVALNTSQSGEPGYCATLTTSALYEGSMDGVTWTTLGSLSNIRANATRLSTSAYGGQSYALNFSFPATTIRWARTTITSNCSSTTSSIYLRSGAVK